MKLGTKILISYLLVFGMGLYYITHGMLENIRFRYLEGVEDTLVDQSRILSSFVSQEMKKKSFSSKKLHQIFDHTYEKSFSAKIYKLYKSSVDIRIYITDKKGHILFDSQYKEKKGTDYSKWRDVYLTLQGKYGARSSHDEDSPDLKSSILYVAAPILIDNKIEGVLSVGKPTTNINNFLINAKTQIKKRSIIAGVLVIFSSIIIMLLITRPIKLLTQYANNIRIGKKAHLPKLDKSEIGDMGRAFDKMREALEGKKYVENYVQTLTHEIKSPLAAIRGASELLEEDMQKEQRSRFLLNIQNESNRIQHLIDRMLELSSLENQKKLKKKERLNFKNLIDSVIERMLPVLSKKEIEIRIDFDKEIIVKGDPFLLKQMISNLVQNAIEFSPQSSKILINGRVDFDKHIITVEDRGPGIPEYALDKVFEKFFSLQRPDTRKKSTGLGLNFVKEVVELHEGTIKLANCENGGACVTLLFPFNKIDGFVKKIPSAEF